ncbi:MAG TPA: HEAT repeat domain-containing protein, partial [Geobacteraceae bacterium]
NEIDITAVFSKKMVKEPDSEAAAEKAATQKGSEQSSGPSEASMADSLADLEIEELITLMKLEEDDDRYCQLANYLQIKGQRLKRDNAFDRLFPILLGLLDQNANERRSATQCACALAIFLQLSRDEMAEHLLDHLEQRDFAKQEPVFRIFAKMGEDAADALVRRMVACNDLPARKAMAAALVSIGAPAVPQLLGVLKDGRWHIVRTAVSILGEVGNRDAVQGLTQSAYHADSRVRMEAIISLAKIGGREATLLLIDLLHDKSQAIRKQVIIWMGNTKNEKTLDPLLRVIEKSDITGRSEGLKREALLAVGRIGDRRALPALYKLVKRRHWLARGCWDRLKLLAIETIGRLGGEEAKEFLEELSVRGGHVGQTSSSVLETMEQRTADHHE